MGFFDLFKSNKKLKNESDDNNKSNQNVNISRDMSIKTIVSIISENDDKVLKRITDCLTDCETYFKNNADAFSERGILHFDKTLLSKIQWLAMVDALEEGQYVCEQDWETESDDFVYFVKELKKIKETDLPLNIEWFDEDEDISTWCTIIDEKWKPFGMCMAGIDIESDSYVMFPCKDDKINKLKELAEQLSYRIDYAKNL